MARRLRLLIGLAAACVALCAASSRAAPATESRPVTEFERISVRGPIDLTVRQAGKAALELRAEPNMLALIETTVEGGTLTIKPKRGENLRGAVRATVDAVQLKAVHASGSGDVAIESLKTPALDLRMSGSGDARLRELATDELNVRLAGSSDVDASGRANKFVVRITGSGDVRARELQSDDVSIHIAGSGDASVTAHKRLAVSIAGSGDVRYAGNPPDVTTSVAGSGTVSKK